MVEVFVTIQRVTSQPSTPPTTSLQLGHSVPRLLTFAGAGLYPQQRGGIPLIPQPTPEPLWAETPKAYSCWGKKHQSCKKTFEVDMVACSYPNSSFFSSNNTCTVHLRIPYTYHSGQGFSNPTVLDPSDSRHLVTIQGNGIQTIFTTHLVTRMRLTMWILLTNQVTGWWFQTLLRFISIHANVSKNTTFIPAWMFVFFSESNYPRIDAATPSTVFTISSIDDFEGRRYFFHGNSLVKVWFQTSPPRLVTKFECWAYDCPA